MGKGGRNQTSAAFFLCEKCLISKYNNPMTIQTQSYYDTLQHEEYVRNFIDGQKRVAQSFMNSMCTEISKEIFEAIGREPIAHIEHSLSKMRKEF